ncbi:nuclear transport factor 2 family protein [Roseomonas hellenica]|uniref:Nuclear transport factor 2 family protein n=1 Tax=Plastoroseomonas hellenica TaxID=2687306 RepID=A0ABS5FAA2_9PROT|nr:nuclear transport factor 2 family protein [Plastoroseomonas hellenica]MBR0669015.1 nuclear transport factor 2 family protein [Plastoroseomonas hellenica]
MSATDNKALMQAIFSRLEQGDRSLLQQHTAEEFRVVVMGRSSWSQTVTADSLQKYQAYVRARFGGSWRTVAERFMADGDLVVVEARGDNYATSGERYDNQYCLVYRFEGGKIVEMREYMDTAFCERVLGHFPSTVLDKQ